ncbi:hypothetical protein X942_660 [Burkholderia pseudomallei MSHR5596]|nr:hypothetical protein X948_5782 [Burkholderia pseudomallei MSHR5608]KGS81858.1 hypothetical protein X942_660 [Burkholderia pseudomallei MSHR5596]MBM5649451.1 peptidase C39 [Burkholderia pseudomallei]
MSVSQDLPFARDAFASRVAIQPLDDEVLARQTGKYADASMISGFTLNLLSQWQLPNGALAVAQGALAVRTNATNQLTAQTMTLAKVVNADGAGWQSSGANPSALVVGGQTVSINGISQVTQVAGNGNSGGNTALVDFNASNAVPAMLPGATSSSTAYASNAAGTVKAEIAFANSGASLVLRTPAGVASQTITPAGALQSGSIAQLLQIAGNGQLASNRLQLQLQTQLMSPALIRQTGILQALQNGVIPRR